VENEVRPSKEWRLMYAWHRPSCTVSSASSLLRRRPNAVRYSLPLCPPKTMFLSFCISSNGALNGRPFITFSTWRNNVLRVTGGSEQRSRIRSTCLQNSHIRHPLPGLFTHSNSVLTSVGSGSCLRLCSSFMQLKGHRHPSRAIKNQIDSDK